MLSQKQFFLFSILPAVGYVVLEEFYSLQIALIGGLILATLEVSLEKYFTGHVHSISKFNFYLIAVLGGISLIGSDGIWFKLQPFFTGLLMGGYLLIRLLKNNSLMLETMKSLDRPVPDEEAFKKLERDMSIFLIIYGCFMAYVAFYLTKEQWLFFKTAGFYIVSTIFFVIEMFILRKKMKEKMKHMQMAQAMERMKNKS